MLRRFYHKRLVAAKNSAANLRRRGLLPASSGSAPMFEPLERRVLLAADPLYSINVGGAEVSAGGVVWSADLKGAPSPYVNTAAAGSYTSQVTGAIDTSDPSLPADTPSSIFYTERYDPVGGADMQWDLPVTPGVYDVRLFFAETYSGTQNPGQRRFNIAIEGQSVEQGFDQVVEADGWRRGIMRSYTVASDGMLDIDFSHDRNNPALKGLQVLAVAAPPPASINAHAAELDFGSVVVGESRSLELLLTHTGSVDSGPISVTGLTLSGAGGASFTAALQSDAVLQPGDTRTVSVTYTATALGSVVGSLQVAHTGENSPIVVALQAASVNAAAVAVPIYRVNVGGSQLAATDGGPAWSVDTKSSPSVYGNAVAAKSTTSSTTTAVDLSHPSIPAGVPQGLFKTERYDPSVGQEMAFAFAVEPGRYELRLYFAETYGPSQQPGRRVFDIVVEGGTVTDNFDQYVAAGAGNRGVAEIYTLDVTDATLNVLLSREVQNPNLKGIEVLRIETSPAPASSLTADAASLAFGSVDVGDVGELDLVLTHSGSLGSDPIDITGVTIAGLNAADFTATLVGGATLQQGDSRTVRVSFQPGTVGGAAGSLTITHTGTNSPLVVAVGGQGTQAAANPPPLAADTATVAFGDIEVGESATLEVVLSHGGSVDSAAITIASVDVVGAAATGYSATLQGEAVLQPGQSRTVQVTATPTAVGGALATLQVTHDGSGGSLNVALSATGVAAPAASPTLGADVGSVGFADVAVNGLAEVEVELAHTGQPGSGPLTLESIAVVDDAGGVFSASLIGLNVLEVGETRLVRVSFAPTAAGLADATLRIIHSGDASPLNIPLSGMGVVDQPQGLTVLYRVNAGGGKLAALDDGPAWAADTGSNPSPYGNATTTGNKTYSTASTIDVSNPSIPSYAPASLFKTERWDPAGGAEMAWAFPVTPGTYDVRLFFGEIYSGANAAGARVFDINIEGGLVDDNLDPWSLASGLNRGVVATYSVVADDVLDILLTHEKENPAIKAIQISRGTPATPGATLGTSTPSLTFAPHTVGSTAANLTTQIVHLGQPGSAPITLTGATLAGPGAAAFSIVSGDTATLEPGQSAPLVLAFNPAAVGSYAATLTLTHTGDNAPVSLALGGDGVVNTPIGFGKSTLVGAWTGSNPTSLQWGPDERLYVGHQNGVIKVYTVTRNDANDYQVIDTQTIFSVKNIANHDDDGTPNSSITNRLVTGILVTGTAAKPVIYVASSDPRIGAGPSGADLNLDTNSGVLSRLTRTATGWDHLDLVRGLPRSEENHASNGLALLPGTNTLLIAQGGHTNMGAPSHNFALQPEYALSAAILQVDLDAIGDTTYDLPTLDDLGQPGTTDPNDPFGGNDGHNQAILVPGGPVSLYATGFRNAYDLVVAQDGRLYTVDNGPNGGWGGPPVDEGDNVTNTPSEPGNTYGDGLHLVTGPGYYAGHPNPTRANPDNPLNQFNGVNPLTATPSPVSTPNPIEGQYLIPGVEDGALHVFTASTNGIIEYTASNFGGQMQHDLLVASFNEVIFRVERNADGTAKKVTKLFQSVGSNPLDVTAVGDDGLFPGSIWVATYGDKKLYIFEPNDFDPDSSGGPIDPIDLDGDGYSNDDEAANGTDPYSAADVPPDWDADFISNLTDPDDDNDTLLDTSDPFAVDATNGASTPIGTLYEWENEGEALGGLLDLGFTGVMTDGTSDYESLYDEAALTAGGAAGVLTIDAAGQGTAIGSNNDGDQGFQFGFNPVGYTGRFAAITRLGGPWQGITPQPGQKMGLQIGDGTQSNFFSLTLDGGGSIELIHEVADTPNLVASAPMSLIDLSQVDLWISIDTTTGTLDASYAVDGGPRLVLVTGVTVVPAMLASPMAVGVLATAGGTGVTLPVTWDHLGVIADPADPIDPGNPGTPGATLATVTIDPPGTDINTSSTYAENSFRIENKLGSGRKISQVTIDLGQSLFPDVVFDPFGTAGDAASKAFTPNLTESTLTGLTTHSYSGDNGGGFEVLTIGFTDFDPGEQLRFAIDIDPTNMKGAPQPGPNHSGSVSGLEMVGATVTVAFDDGSTLINRAWHLPGSVDGSRAVLADNLPVAPSLQALGVAGDNATVTGTAQTLRITGTPGQAVSLLQVEGGLYLAGVPGGGFDIDPFEANVALNQQEFDAVIGSQGYADIPVTLLDTDSPASGINHFIATARTPDGRAGGVSLRVILQLI